VRLTTFNNIDITGLELRVHFRGE